MRYTQLFAVVEIFVCLLFLSNVMH